MAQAEDQKLKEALESALDAADAADDTLTAARISDCLWRVTQRMEQR